MSTPVIGKGRVICRLGAGTSPVTTNKSSFPIFPAVINWRFSRIFSFFIFLFSKAEFGPKVWKFQELASSGFNVSLHCFPLTYSLEAPSCVRGPGPRSCYRGRRSSRGAAAEVGNSRAGPGPKARGSWTEFNIVTGGKLIGGIHSQAGAPWRGAVPGGAARHGGAARRHGCGDPTRGRLLQTLACAAALAKPPTARRPLSARAHTHTPHIGVS